MSYNTVILVGRLGAEPEHKTTQSGTKVCKLRLATDTGYGERKRTDWHNVVAFGPLADVAARAAKGSQLLIEGSICYRKAERPDGGVIHYTDIYADEIRFLGNRPAGSGERKPARTYPNGPGDVADYQDEYSAAGTPIDGDMPF